jgi:hypothetical protein
VELIAILTVMTLLGVAMSWSAQRAAAEVEVTLRLAIEKGVLVDAALIPLLREPAGLSWIERFTLLGMMTLFAGAGVIAVAVVLMVTASGFPVPLFALAAFAACLGVGLIACARWLKRVRHGPA